MLQPPATDQQIAAVEDAHGFVLHPDLKALLRLHDGTPWDAARPTHGCFLPMNHRLSSTQRIIGVREVLVDYHEDWGDSWPEEDPLAHTHQWVVFAEPNDGGMVFIDHHPGPTYGHVYEFGMGSGASEVTLWAASLTDLFAALATAVETGTPFRGFHPTFFELRHTDMDAFAGFVGRRIFEWNSSPDEPAHDGSSVVHRIAAGN
ncbi:hypothetical protein ACTIVE_8816 [Actinomadura verrucosospora]|uniref:Knr4/Smi1-like domain-containing protein n=1 Tax=Actinomadura verrucosospora TaxID=46165 RepID=A0A7D3ZT65_ACTVE|nr:hypothetical protein ACTIVE_8816 [Actinomadura verrucosospora]